MRASWDSGTLDVTACGSAVLYEDSVVLCPGTRFAVINKLELDAHLGSCLWKDKSRLKAPLALNEM